MSKTVKMCQLVGGPFDGDLRSEPSVVDRILASHHYCLLRRGDHGPRHKYAFDPSEDVWVYRGQVL